MLSQTNLQGAIEKLVALEKQTRQVCAPAAELPAGSGCLTQSRLLISHRHLAFSWPL